MTVCSTIIWLTSKHWHSTNSLESAIHDDSELFLQLPYKVSDQLQILTADSLNPPLQHDTNAIHSRATCTLNNESKLTRQKSWIFCSLRKFLIWDIRNLHSKHYELYFCHGTNDSLHLHFQLHWNCSILIIIIYQISFFDNLIIFIESCATLDWMQNSISS